MTEMETQQTTDIPDNARYRGIRADGKRCLYTIPENQPHMLWAQEDDCPLSDAVSKVMSAIDHDSPKNFTWQLADPILQEDMESYKSQFGKQVINKRAIDCAQFIADGETSVFGLDPDFGLGGADGWTAVHQAALNFHNDAMLRFLLKLDYSADVRADIKKHSLKQVLPLNVLLHRLRFSSKLDTFWASTDDTSAPSLLKELYTLDYELETVRLLALKTRDFKHEFFNYAKEGKMFEVGALLLAVGEKLTPLSISEEEANLNSFKDLSHFLQAKNSNIDEFAELKETVELLDIYDEIGYQLSAYVALKENRRTGEEVAALLKDAGFDEKIDDHNVQDYVNRSNRASFELKVPSFFWDHYLAYCKQKMPLANWMNKMVQSFPSRSKSQHPSTRTKQLTDTTLFNNMSASHQFGTVATKVVNAMQKFSRFGKYGSWRGLKRFFPRS